MGVPTTIVCTPNGFSSGAILALLAAEHEIGIQRLSLLEPPLRVDVTPPPPSGISGEVAKLIITGRRREAYERWLTGIGVPTEMITEMREGPSGPPWRPPHTHSSTKASSPARCHQIG
jgi:hypothetical protein